MTKNCIFKAAINLVIWALLLFISACLIADTARQYDKKNLLNFSLCDILDQSDYDAKCGHLVAASVSFVFFSFYAFILLCMFVKVGETHTPLGGHGGLVDFRALSPDRILQPKCHADAKLTEDSSAKFCRSSQSSNNSYSSTLSITPQIVRHF